MKNGKRIVSWVCATGLAVAVPCLAEIASTDLNKAARFQQKGDRALRTGNLDAAEEQFRKAIEAVPDFPAARIGLGQIEMSRERFEAALRHFEQARDGYHAVGEALREFEMKRYAQTQNDIQELRDNIVQVQTYNTNVQEAQIQISRLQSRIDYLESIGPPDRDAPIEPPGEVYFYIGNALFSLDRLEDAVVAWEACRDRSPKFAMVYNNLALGYGQQGKLEEAVTSLDRAEELGFAVNPQFRADLERALEQSGS